MSAKQGRKIALVGASGNVGKPTTSYLLAEKIHTLTALQRPESTSTFPSEISVKKGDLTDEDFLVEALKGQEVLIVQLPFTAGAAQSVLIRAAAKAGVKYVVPVEFGSDPYGKMVEDFDILYHKRDARNLIEELGGSSWIAVITNPWLDYGLKMGAWGFAIKDRKATLWGGGNSKVNTMTLRAVGESTAALLSLPEAELEQFRNKPYYASTMYVTQREMFESILRATKTTEKDWEVTTPDLEQAIKESDAALKAGDRSAFRTKFYAAHFRDGYGGDFESKLESKKFGVAEENLDKVIEEVVASA